jgi:septum site-determining protein MinC
MSASSPPTAPLPVEPQAVDLPSLTETTNWVCFDASVCRTGVHALKAFEDWLEEQAVLRQQEEGQHRGCKQLLELDLASLVLGQRQLHRFVQMAQTYGYQVQRLKSEALVTRQLAMQQQLPLAPSTAAIEEERSQRNVSNFSLKNRASSSSSSLQNAAFPETLRFLEPLPSGSNTNSFQYEQTRCVQAHLRSGQSLEFEGNIVLIGDAHRGSEIRATGNIIVWGELLGLAHAGCLGKPSAEIRALKLDPLQLRIADVIARRPDQWTHEPCLSGEAGMNKALRDPLWRGEVARIVEGEIQLLQVAAL